MNDEAGATTAVAVKVPLTPEQLLAAVTALEMQDTATLIVQDIYDQTDLMFDGEPLMIELYSSGSDEGVKAAHRVAQNSQVRSMGYVRGKIDKKYGETMDREEVDKLCGHTKRIIHKSFPLSPRQLYSNPKLGYITKQVQKFIVEDENFAKPSTPS